MAWQAITGRGGLGLASDFLVDESLCHLNVGSRSGDCDFPVSGARQEILTLGHPDLDPNNILDVVDDVASSSDHSTCTVPHRQPHSRPKLGRKVTTVN